MRKKYKPIKGSCLEHGQAHDCHHEGISRRDFLFNLGLVGAGSIALAGLPVNKLFGSPVLSSLSNTERILVIIRLKGGNDGLNTFVPVFDYGTYSSYRPILKIDQANLLALDSKYSVPDYAASLKTLWDTGKMKVVQNAGYANHDLSHFVSTDIWDSADTSIGAVSKSGWLGRYLWDQHPDFLTQPPAVPLAIHIGGDGNILFFNQDNINMAMNVVDPAELYRIAQTGSLYPVNGTATCYYQDQLDFMKSMINSTYNQSESIKNAYDAGSNTVTYPAGLGNSLSLVSRLIKGGLNTKIYMLTIDGFDTHASQDDRYPDLLTELSDSVKSFFDDLAADGKDQQTLCMTFSEFGRRVNDNGSRGTDHGTAAPLLFFGPALNGNGFVGDDVNLTDLDFNGNLKFKIDFRQVYATVLRDWMCADELTTDTILGGHYSKLSLGFDCASVSARDIATIQLYHQLRYEHGNPFIVLHLPESANVQLEAFDLMGRRILSTDNDYYSAGTHRLPVQGITTWSAGAYLYKLRINGKLETGKMQKY